MVTSRAMSALTDLLLLVTALAVAIHLLLAYVKFRRLELAIPGPPSLPLLGNLKDFIGLKQEAFLPTYLRLADPHQASIWRFSILGQLMVTVSDPDHLQEVLARKEFANKDRFVYRLFRILGNGSVSLNGAEWRAHRRAFLPAFHPRVLDRFTPEFSAEALGFVRHVRPGRVQEVAYGLQSAAARTFLWTAVASDKAEEEERVERMMPDFLALADAYSQSFAYRMVQPWLWPDWAFLRLTAIGRRIGRLVAKSDAHFVKTVADRRTQLRQEERMEADDGLSDKRRCLLDILLEPGDRLSLSDEEIIAELKTFMGAATDTTAATLSWALKTLSLRQDVQERLLQEAKEVVGKDEDVTAADIDKLEYTERVIKETLRLLPPVPLIAREVSRETELGGYTLPAGTTLGLNILGVHRDPRHWPDPLRFDPDRFLPENSEGRHPYAYLPFSAGPRNCIGGRYAMMSMKTLLATLVQRYRIDPVDDGYKEPADFPMASGIISWMVGGWRVVFTPREGCSGA